MLQQIKYIHRRLAGFGAWAWPDLALALAMAAVACSINWQLFITPIYESGDFAANALQIQKAQTFSELLGNYSRFRFHHPGPAFFYVYGACEAIFYRLLGIVPAPQNAEMLGQILLSITAIVGTLGIIRRNCTSTVILPLTTALTILFIYAISNASPGSALVSIWAPHFIIFWFPLFMVACASLAVGNWNHLPVVAFSAMMLFHAHVAQTLFVGTLGGLALATTIFREVSAATLARTLRAQWVAILIGTGIVALFAFPILLDYVLNTPGNIGMILQHERKYPGLRNTLQQSLLYTASFFTFTSQAEQVLGGVKPGFTSLLNGSLFVRVYWSLVLVFGSFTALSVIIHRPGISRFAKYLVIQAAVVVVLFVYWAAKLTGPFYTFNGFFFFTLQWVLLLAFAVTLAETYSVSFRKETAAALACALASTMLLSAPELQNVNFGTPDAHRVAEAVAGATAKPVYLQFDGDDWDLAVGVASALRRQGMQFCVSPNWAFLFGHDALCQGDSRLRFARGTSDCASPCRVILRHGDVAVEYMPRFSAVVRLPLRLTAADNLTQKDNFLPPEGGSRWSNKSSEIRFLLARPEETAGPYSFTITGSMLPGRPVKVWLNGRALGEISSEGRGSRSFPLSDGALRWDDENVVRMEVDNAGPLNQDPRELGYFFENIQITGGKSGGLVTFEVIPESVAPRLLTGVTWKFDQVFRHDGHYVEIGNLAKGPMWSSYNGSDANVGGISAVIVDARNGCVVIPVGHGPALTGQRVWLSDASTHKKLLELPLVGLDGKWRLYAVHYDPGITKVEVFVEDRGSGWGQWIAVGQPRACP